MLNTKQFHSKRINYISDAVIFIRNDYEYVVTVIAIFQTLIQMKLSPLSEIE